jgi:DNA polymerase III epsilon subunit-like protein
MSHVTIFDCEYLTAEGAMNSRWCGPHDPDPCVAQIGSVKLSLEPGFKVLDTQSLLIRTVDRLGKGTDLDPYFVELTGIDNSQIENEGISLEEALAEFDRFSGGSSFWSWGKDELNLLAVSCYVAEIKPLIPAHRFGNAMELLLRAGLPREDVLKTTSGELADTFGLKGSPRRHHDAVDDAMSIALSLQHLLLKGRLAPEDFFRAPPLPIRLNGTPAQQSPAEL